MKPSPSTWSTSTPPMDGTWIIARGRITWADNAGGGSFPFIREIQYSHREGWSGWLDEDGVAIATQVDDQVHVDHWSLRPDDVDTPAVPEPDRLRNAIARRYLAARLAEDACVRGYDEITEREKVTGVYEWDESLRLLKARNRWWRRGLHLMHAVNPGVDTSHGSARDPILLGCEGWPASALGRRAA